MRRTSKREMTFFGMVQICYSSQANNWIIILCRKNNPIATHRHPKAAAEEGLVVEVKRIRATAAAAAAAKNRIRLRLRISRTHNNLKIIMKVIEMEESSRNGVKR